MLEFPDVEERREKLQGLAGIEGHLYAQVGDGTRIECIADEDLDRTSEGKTSAVHFVRFEFDTSDIDALKAGASLKFIIDHPAYSHQSDLTADQLSALVADFD